MNNFLRRAWKWLGWSILSISILVVISNIWVIASTSDKILKSLNDLPDNSVVLVLGTSNKLVDGSPNPFFLERIWLASLLYENGKASRFLLSGDNRTKYYNEPFEMRKALVQAGVPDSIITLDFAGLRTLDSIVRCKEIFGQSKIIIVTQSFHCYRALFISKFYDIDAVALWTNNGSAHSSARVNVREWFARAKAIIDLYFLRTSPKHLGEPQPLVLHETKGSDKR